MTLAGRIVRTAALCALLASVPVSAAAARPIEDPQASAALSQERYYSSYGDPPAITAGASAVYAQERYYSSYGDAEPLTLPQPSAPSDGFPWLVVSLSIAAALAIAAASTTHLRRLRVRRRSARPVSS